MRNLTTEKLTSCGICVIENTPKIFDIDYVNFWKVHPTNQQDLGWKSQGNSPHTCETEGAYDEVIPRRKDRTERVGLSNRRSI